MGERRFCYKCMGKFDSDLNNCPYCGYDVSAPHNPQYIAPGTILHDRYIVGVLLEYNGEGATYEGYDRSTDCRCLLREYMPINLCTRLRNKATISVNYNNLAKYKAFMAEYTELNKSLARLRNNSNINPVLDMFAENNTTYTVFEHIDGVKILDYLRDNSGELSWEQVTKLFPPLFTTIGILHNSGIIHRAISPDTVYITSKNELKLSGFCVSAVRTANAGLEYELFKGYAAPEQYSASSSSHQGSWTDVYGICALLYRALTGCMPVDSVSRLKHDDLCEPERLNPSIPAHVSRVIMEGMALSSKDRIKTITELVTRLFEAPGPVKRTVQPEPENEPPVQEYIPQQQQPTYQSQPYQPYGQPQQPVYTPPVQPQYQPPYGEPINPPPYPEQPAYDQPSQRRKQTEYEEVSVNTVDRIKVPIIIGILFLAILLIIGSVIINIIAPGAVEKDTTEPTGASIVTDNIVTGENTTSATEATTLKADTEMPNLVGKYYEFTEEKYKDYFVFEAIYDYNNDYESDMIYEQDIKPGTLVAQGSLVKVKVSKGNEGAMIPEYEGLTLSQYENRLKEAGITNYSLIASTSEWGTPGSITQLQVNGSIVTAGGYFSNKDGNKLIVYYIPNETVYETEAPATEAPAPVVTEAVTEAPAAVVTDAPVVTEPASNEPDPFTPEPVTDAQVQETPEEPSANEGGDAEGSQSDNVG
ncbi:MAG: PASTA domain-containing protein [Ruminococcus sp.]|nr:PASTA domain-containing protein [Ruminococcus sp.]